MRVDDREPGFDKRDALAGLAGAGAFSLRRAGAHTSFEAARLPLASWRGTPGCKALPFGLGLHPWLPRNEHKPGLRRKRNASRSKTATHLPAGELDVRAREDWNFATLRRLPEGWINNAFLGWNGRASVVCPDRRMSLEISAEAPISTYIVYSGRAPRRTSSVSSR